MQSLHQRVHELRKVKVDDPIPVLATEIAKKSWLLCFDEFQVTDIADAMLLRRLCAELFEQGVVMVATSNRHPNDLYLNGIQRKEFLPTIELVKERLKVFHLDAGLDYRKTEKKKVQVFSFSGTADSLDLLWKKLTKEKPIEQKILHIWGRELVMEQSCGRMALTDFDSLCAKPHSAADYLALCEHYDVLLIRNIPKLNLDSRNEARRLITLIDAVYDSRIKLLCHFQMDNLDQLFTASSKSTFDTAKQDQVKGSQHDEVFAFDRTKSRLIEMQNAQWLGDHYTSLIN
jgi:protein AFG1